MKKYLLFFLFCSYFSFAQNTVIQNNSTSYTITPNSITSQHPASGTNVSVGTDALKFNQILPSGTTLGGIQNTAVGYQALYNNTSSDSNTGLGYQALFSNTTGRTNLGIGPGALFKNSTGDYNTAVGEGALYYNITGSKNTAGGIVSLVYNTGSENTAYGYYSGFRNTTGELNTLIGAFADVSINNLTNATAIGYNASVNASNKVRIGNSAVTVIEGQVPLTYPSDRRLKENIIYTNTLGLNFISRLNTVSFNYKSDPLKTRRDGLIAQDILSVLKEIQVPFSGLIVGNDNETLLSLSSSELVFPLINAIKELSKQNETLRIQNKSMESRLEKIEARLEQSIK